MKRSATNNVELVLLRDELDRYDDFVLLERAEGFCRRHRRMTNSQVYGLENLAYSTDRLQDIIDYLEHQGSKARKESARGKWKFHYWLKLKDDIRVIENEITGICTRRPGWNALKEEEKAVLVLEKVRDYIIHIVAETQVMLGRKRGRRNERSNLK